MAQFGGKMNIDEKTEVLVNTISMDLFDLDEKDNQDLTGILKHFEILSVEVSALNNEALNKIIKILKDAIESLILREIEPIEDLDAFVKQIYLNFELLQNLIEKTISGSNHHEIIQKINDMPTVHESEPEESQELQLEQVDSELFGDFLNESREYIDSLESNIIELEKFPNNLRIINEIFRPFHTLKGVSSFMGLKKLNHISHETENILDLARNSKLRINKNVISVILIAIDHIKRIVYNLSEEDRTERINDNEIENLIILLKNLVNQPETNIIPEKISLPELRSEIHPESQPELSIDTSQDSPVSKKTDDSIRIKTDKLDYLIDTVGELVISFNLIREDKNIIQISDHEFIKKISQLSRVISDLQNASMALRMIPIGNTLQKMKRVVRDYTNQNHKDINLVLEGEETEIDRNIVDSLYDPLVHMIRNSCDHGIEDAEERQMLGKPKEGNVTLAAYHKGNSLVIDVIDDGKGLNKKKIYEKALEKGLIKKDDPLTDDQIFKLIFQPGFSTVEKVTKVSGRGVGMDVVQQAIKNLGGHVDIITETGVGSTFRLVFPLTLAIIEGMLVKVEDQLYIIPIGNIQRSLKPDKSQLNRVFEKGETLRLNDQLIPIIRLNKKFKLSETEKDLSESLLIILHTGNKEFAIAVDHLIGIQSVVVKSLGEKFKNLEGVSGATIMGDGRVGLILDANELYYEEK